MKYNKQIINLYNMYRIFNNYSWEQRKINQIIEDIADGPFGSNLKAEHYTDNREARIVQLSNIGENGWQDQNIRYTTYKHAKMIKRSIVKPGELIMAKMMPAGLTIKCPDKERMYVLGSDSIRIKLNNRKIDDKYFLAFTKSDVFLQQINNDIQGSTRARTSINKVRNMKIYCPIQAEQQKIGSIFYTITSLITLHQHK